MLDNFLKRKLLDHIWGTLWSIGIFQSTKGGTFIEWISGPYLIRKLKCHSEKNVYLNITQNINYLNYFSLWKWDIYFLGIPILIPSQQARFSKNKLTVAVVICSKIIIQLNFIQVFIILSAFLHYRERMLVPVKSHCPFASRNVNTCGWCVVEKGLSVSIVEEKELTHIS